MIGKAGDDTYGGYLIAKLLENDIDISGVEVAPYLPSNERVVMIDEETHESRCVFSHVSQGATAAWKKKDFSYPEQFGDGEWLDLIVAQMEIDKKVVETMIETAGHADIPFCLNAAPASPINPTPYQLITHLVVNESGAAILLDCTEDEVEVDCPKAAKRFLNLGVQNVVITLGAKGAYYANAKVSGLCAGYAVPVLDTNGAGLTQVLSNTFTGAYAADYVRQISSPSGEWDIESAVVRANQAAAISIGSAGAQGHIPWANEIDLFDMMAEMTLD
ncbi:putative ribokinase protein [Colletotrichum scovillei]|uniref:putative ribokinase protein n=1 Tax=Colletotrichum scovillei TaxID=1209932 RepID=UPI0015C2F3D0|nr:putative ribokinase protein [Colletotrichum scovillei]KAF4781106.1 putative ribokinase protein [Colletotrichum scovillei]